MPRPPGSQRQVSDADPDLIWGVSPIEEPPGLTLTNLVRGIHEVVLAERLVAETRHGEIMQRLHQDMEGIQSHYKEESKQLMNIEHSLSRSCQQLGSEQISGSQDLGGRKGDSTWSERVSQVQHEANEKGCVQDLAKDSKFEFGTKYHSEDSKGLDMYCFLNMSRNIRQICRHRWFEILVSGLITLNALVMCFEVQHDGVLIGRKLKYQGITSYGTWTGEASVYTISDWFFGVVFTMEALMKLVGFRLEYFRPGWNTIDFLCVVAFVIGKVSDAFDIEVVDSQTIRLIRLFRLARLVRLIRTLEKLDMLYIITTAIKGMKMIVVWAVALLSVILMTCALFLSGFLQSTYFNVDFETLSDDEMKVHKELYKYFGSFTRCMLSMFELTLANWPPVARLLTEEVSEWFGLFCVLHKLSIGFAVIGVINGVILQETFKVAHTDDMVMVRQKKRAKIAMQKKMEALFQSLDIDKDGEIGFSEFMIISAQPDVKLWLESLDIETDDLLTLFLLIDVNGNGTLTLEELLEQVPRLRGGARGIDMLAVRKNIPSFLLSPEDDGQNLYTWREMNGPNTDMREAIGEAKFTWKPGSSESCASLDAILRRADSIHIKDKGGASPQTSKRSIM